MQIESALRKYAEGYNALWECVKKENSEFPEGLISNGTIAEYYAKLYLEERYKGWKIEYGKANEKAWDIKVEKGSSKILFQVKSVSFFNGKRKLSKLKKGFDQLIVISLDCEFFPFQAYLFESVEYLFEKSSCPVLTVPNPDNARQYGSKAFKKAINIHQEFFETLANKL